MQFLQCQWEPVILILEYKVLQHPLKRHLSFVGRECSAFQIETNCIIAATAKTHNRKLSFTERGFLVNKQVTRELP
jgi:hypothetical protein